LWNTTFKIIFIGAQFYIIYLMLNDYRPTHDPNQDTFKVEYLVGGAAVMGILFPYKYTITEVCDGSPSVSARVHANVPD
jgi:ER lumen protein retaining receptor